MRTQPAHIPHQYHTHMRERPPLHPRPSHPTPTPNPMLSAEYWSLTGPWLLALPLPT